jgi:hypothetical protein
MYIVFFLLSEVKIIHFIVIAIAFLFAFVIVVVLSFSYSVFYRNWQQNLWFVFILFKICGMPSSHGLSFVGLCLTLSRSYWRVGGRGVVEKAVVWKMVPHCILWCIWREQNNRCFEDSSRTRDELLHFFLVTLSSWTTGWLFPRVISLVDFFFLFSPFPPSLLCILPMY